MAHPPLAIEIAHDRIAGVRWTRHGHIADLAIEALPSASIVPSALETNIGDVKAVADAFSKIATRLKASDEDVALLLPDSVIRVFIQHFDEFPRSDQQALPLLRWKLKKSVPFPAEEMLISYTVQPSRESGVDVVAALSRDRIIREYDALAATVNLRAGIVLSSSLAAVSLLEGEKPALMARISDSVLTTAIVRDGILCGYRCTELPVSINDLTPAIFLDEIFPVAAYFQDTWQESVQSVLISGLGARLPEFVPPLETEFRCKVESLLVSATSDGLVPDFARPLVDEDLHGLVGWMLNHEEVSK